MKPWIRDKKWFNKYARGLLALKESAHNSTKVPAEIREVIETAFTRVYRAVAFDIDGTLTENAGIKVDRQMALVVGRLLQRGVPVFLITGRGRTSCRMAAQEIKKYSGLTDWYLRRLQCITHNGVFLLQTPIDRPTEFLSLETLIAPELDGVQSLLFTVRRVIAENGLHLSQAESIEVTREPHSVRLTFGSTEDRALMEKALFPLVKGLREDGASLYLSRGSYANFSCLDLVGTNKKLALEHVATRIGVEPERILRIGDQGQEGGNDFDLLDSPAGFTVGEFSSNPTGCHPVLDADLRTPLSGVQATERLLELVLLFPALSIAAIPLEERLRSIRNFEKLATIRTREESVTVTQRLRVRLRYLLPDSSGFANPHNLEISDIYDRLSGGVKFRDWELDSMPDNHTALELFETTKLQLFHRNEPRSNWCMYTDTGVLMRGANYYFGMTTPLSDRTITTYLDIVESFIRDAIEALILLSQEEADLTRYKLILAIQDNIRNMLLQLLYAAFVAEGTSLSRTYHLTQRIYQQSVLPHTRQHFDFLLNADADWVTSLLKYRELLTNMRALIQQLRISLIDLIEGKVPVNDMFKWRECDHFLQNVTAVQLGLHELRQREEIRRLERAVVVGLAYGGTELPAIAQAVAYARGFNLKAALAKVSIYGDLAVSKKIRAGELDYVTDLLSRAKPLCMLDDTERVIEDVPFIIMDDNCTTCVTLQLARDFLVLQGADVVGAIVVRFPGVNRLVHMALPGHGVPDPEVLFSFIRGLVAPSPYTRLIYPQAGENPYLDQTNMFDKAKDRIRRYLEKNGTPVRKD